MKVKLLAVTILALGILLFGTATAMAGLQCSFCGSDNSAVTFIVPQGGTGVDYSPLYHCYLCWCNNCNKPFWIDELHNDDGIDPAVAPTCTETGLTQGSHCSVCGAVIVAQQEVPATGHTEVTDPAVAPTCTETGLTVGSHCSVCGAVIAERKIAPALGHQYKIVETVAPTCLRGGYSLMRCARCGDETKANIKERLSHWYGPWSPAGDGTHTAECVRCGHTGSAPCEPGPVTVAGITLNVCPVCGAVSGGGDGMAMASVDGAGVKKTPGNELPSGGELVARSTDGPMGEDSRVLRLYTLAYELAGKTLETEPLSVSLPLGGEFPAFRLVCVSGLDAGKEIPFEIKEGTLVFTASLPGVFVLMAE